MFETLRGGASKRTFGKSRHEPADPLARTIVMDLLITTAGFLMMVVAVVLSVEGLSLN